jgi:hypothetical protein
MARFGGKDHDSMDEGELDDREYPDERDVALRQEPRCVACDHCGKMIRDDAERCHKCGQYQVDTDRRVPAWVFFAAVFVLCSLILSAVHWIR